MGLKGDCPPCNCTSQTERDELQSAHFFAAVPAPVTAEGPLSPVTITHMLCLTANTTLKPLRYSTEEPPAVALQAMADRLCGNAARRDLQGGRAVLPR
jgi:hypothetical protein